MEDKKTVEQSEVEKLPSEIQSDIEKEKVREKKLNSERVDWFGIDNAKQDFEYEEQENYVEGKEKGLVSSVVDSMIEIFSSTENKKIKEVEASNMNYLEVGNVKIRDGVIYAKNVMDIVEAGIKPSKNNLWVVIPHTKKVNSEISYKVELRYVLHDGLCWVMTPSYTKLEEIEYSLLEESNLPNIKKIKK